MHRATSSNICALLNQLACKNDLDLLIIGFWGRKLQAHNGQIYLCGVEASEADIDGSAIGLEFLEEKISLVGAGNVFIILEMMGTKEKNSLSSYDHPLSSFNAHQLKKLAKDIQLIA
jgi:hypothetical protein